MDRRQRVGDSARNGRGVPHIDSLPSLMNSHGSPALTRRPVPLNADGGGWLFLLAADKALQATT